MPQTFSLVSSLIPFHSRTFARSIPNATLAFAFQAVNSSLMCFALERVLPKTANLSTTVSVCPFTVIVTVGSLYGFPGAGWCTTSVFLC